MQEIAQGVAVALVIYRGQAGGAFITRRAKAIDKLTALRFAINHWSVRCPMLAVNKLGMDRACLVLSGRPKQKNKLKYGTWYRME